MADGLSLGDLQALGQQKLPPSPPPPTDTGQATTAPLSKDAIAAAAARLKTTPEALGVMAAAQHIPVDALIAQLGGGGGTTTTTTTAAPAANSASAALAQLKASKPDAPAGTSAGDALAALKANRPSPIQDYSGLSISDQSNFIAADNDAERQIFLQQGVDAGKWQSFGSDPVDPALPDVKQWWVMKNGVKTAVIGLDVTKTIPAYGLAHPLQMLFDFLASRVPEFRPAVGLAAESPMAAGVVYDSAKAFLKDAAKRGLQGTVYNAMRATIMGMANTLGAGADDAIKWLNDRWARAQKDPTEADRLIDDFASGAFTEMLFRAGGSAIKWLRSGYGPLTTPEHRVDVESVLNRGMVPGVSQATQGKSILLRFDQWLFETIFGGPAQQKRNLGAMKIETQKQLEAIGYSPDRAKQATLALINSWRQRVDRQGVVDRIRQSARRVIAQLTANVDTMRQGLQTNLDENLARLDALAGSSDPATQELIRNQLIKARREFGDAMDPFYARVDEAIAASPYAVMVDNEGLKEAARNVLREFPTDIHGNPLFNPPQIGGIIRDILNLPRYSSFGENQIIRKRLFEAGAYRSLTPTREATLLNRLGEAADRGFERGIDANATNREAVLALRTADEEWTKGIQKFQGDLVKRLYRDPQRTAQADAASVAGWIFQPGKSADAQKVLAHMDEPTRRAVLAAYWEHLKLGATNFTTGKIKADKFLATVREEYQMIRDGFGEDHAKAILQFAEHNAALNGTLDSASLTSDNFMTRLQTWQSEQAALEARMKNRWISDLLDPRADHQDPIAYMLAAPERIAEAKSFFGETSPEWQAIRGEAMQKVLADSIGHGDDLATTLFRPGGLSEVLSQFSESQLDELFGKSHADALRQFARDIDLVTARPGTQGTTAVGMAAMNLVLHPLKHLKRLAQVYILGHVLASEKMVRYLALGLKPETQASIGKWAGRMKSMIWLGIPAAQQWMLQGQQSADQETNRTVQ